MQVTLHDDNNHQVSQKYAQKICQNCKNKITQSRPKLHFLNLKKKKKTNT